MMKRLARNEEVVGAYRPACGFKLHESNYPTHMQSP